MKLRQVHLIGSFLIYKYKFHLNAQASVNGSRGAGLEVGDLGDELNRALAGEEVMVGHATDSNHSEAAILDLFELVLGELLSIVLKAERVEANVTSTVDGAVSKLQEERDLKQADEPEDLPEGSRLDGSIVEAPHLLAVVPLVEEREVIHVLNNRSKGGKHADAAVLDLSLTSPHNVANSAEEAAVDRPVRRGLIPVGAEIRGRVEALHAHLGVGHSTWQSTLCKLDK
jgi:hypothetical protein